MRRNMAVKCGDSLCLLGAAIAAQAAQVPGLELPAPAANSESPKKKLPSKAKKSVPSKAR